MGVTHQQLRYGPTLRTRKVLTLKGKNSGKVARSIVKSHSNVDQWFTWMKGQVCGKLLEEWGDNVQSRKKIQFFLL